MRTRFLMPCMLLFAVLLSCSDSPPLLVGPVESQMALPDDNTVGKLIPSAYGLEVGRNGEIYAAMPSAGRLRCEIRNATGYQVRLLCDRYCEPGLEELVWDLKNDDGKECGDGIYIVHMEASQYTGDLPIDVER